MAVCKVNLRSIKANDAVKTLKILMRLWLRTTVTLRKEEERREDDIKRKRRLENSE